MKLINVYITFPTQEAAEKIAHKLVEQRLLACANIFPITSVFRWHGRIQQDKEYALVGKTVSVKYPALCKTVLALHPYDVPCIEKIPVQANALYAQWVSNEVMPKS